MGGRLRVKIPKVLSGTVGTVTSIHTEVNPTESIGKVMLSSVVAKVLEKLYGYGWRAALLRHKFVLVRKEACKL